MRRTIWYISKYAVSPEFGNPSRQFFFAKYMVRKNRNVTLISSRSAQITNKQKLKFKNQLFYNHDNVKGVLINGPIINLGFNAKRIYSWLVFETRLLYWALFRSKETPDVVVVSSLSLFTFLTGIVLKKKFKCKLICEVRDIWPLTIIESKRWSNKNFFIRFLSFIEKKGYEKADVIIGTMANLKEHVMNVYPSAIKKVRYIPMGFDPDKFESTLEDKSNTFETIPENSFIVGYAGTIGFINCIGQIIEAAEILRNENIVFVLLGDGPVKKQMKDKVEQLKLSNVLFFDTVDHKQVRFFLDKCDLLLHPSAAKNKIYQFGLSPNKWIDYMYSGKPILVTLDGFPSILNEAGCGKFISPDNQKVMADEILHFSKMDKIALKKMGENGKKYLLQNLTYDKLTDKFLEIIDE